MTIGQTVERARDGAMQRITEAKIDRTTRENEELKTENRLLRDELSESRSERKQVLDLLEKGQFTTAASKPRRGTKLLRLVAFGGAVYAIGVKTGALERVKNWMRGRTEGFDSELREKGSEAAYRAGDVIEHAGRTTQDAGRTMEKLGDDIERKADGLTS